MVTPSIKKYMHVIIKGEPVPEPRKGIVSESVYPFKQMELGDSFVVQESEAKKQTVLGAIQAYQRKTGAKFATRTVKEGKAIQVWKIKLEAQREIQAAEAAGKEAYEQKEVAQGGAGC